MRKEHQRDREGHVYFSLVFPLEDAFIKSHSVIFFVTSLKDR